MRNDVHAAALKAAAKLALSMVVLNGCANGSDKSDDEASTESAILGTERPKETKPGADGGASCDAVLAAAYPVPGGYQWEPVAQSKAVVQCCDQELAGHPFSSRYQWDCCVAFDPTATEPTPSHGLACTPWGPPVPPSMDRIAQRRAARLARKGAVVPPRRRRP